MTFAWLLVDAAGRRKLLVGGSVILTTCFLLPGLFGGLAYNSSTSHIPTIALVIPGTVVLFVATSAFEIGWIATVRLTPTETYPTAARARGDGYQRDHLGPSKFRRHAADANRIQQPRILDLPRLRRHEYHRWDLDLRVPARERRTELRGKLRVL